MFESELIIQVNTRPPYPGNNEGHRRIEVLSMITINGHTKTLNASARACYS